MPIRKMLLLLLLPLAAHADDSLPTDAATDTFDQLLIKQAQLLNSAMDMQIRQNQNQGSAAAVSNANPLPGAKQEVNDQEPIVEAIWGLAGKEVAEINYKGRRVPVSMQEPFISKVDGWKLESIAQYQIQLVRTEGKRVVQRKTIMLDWMGGQGSQILTTTVGSNPPIAPPAVPITPAITAPLMRQ